MIDWTAVLVALISATAIIIGGVLTFLGVRANIRNSRDTRLSDDVRGMRKRLDKVEKYLRAEQRFSHRLVLMLQTVIHYVTAAKLYRDRHAHILPKDDMPELPDIGALHDLIEQRPTYDDE